MRYRHLLMTVALTAFWKLAIGAAVAATEPPPNSPADVRWDGPKGTLQLSYHGTVIFDAVAVTRDEEGAETPAEIALESKRVSGEADSVEQRLKLRLVQPRDGCEFVLRGTLSGSPQAFAAETDCEAQKRFPLVRTSVGLSHSLRNNAVYDRRWDWVLIGPADGATRIRPAPSGKAGTRFAWECRSAPAQGAEPPVIELVFRPRFYQKHKQIGYFEPWTYDVWESPVTGYCTWWAYREHFSQKTLDAVVDIFAAKHLPDFGYKYVQLDDAYQTSWGGCPENWLTWNGKFPGGAEYAVRKITSAGMEPGIWVNRLHRPHDRGIADIGKEHPNWFAHKPDGGMTIKGGWHQFFVLNTKNREAVDNMIRPTYRQLKKQGWRYVKIDAAGDLLYATRSEQCAEHFKRIGSTPEASLREWDRVAREELGPDIYILTCWGVEPGVCSVGLADGCRLSDDGFGPATFQRFASWNGVVWRSDPDHCDIMAPAFKEKTTMATFGVASAMTDTIVQPSIVAMAGGALMVSDKVEAYRDDANLEGMKRSAPVLFTVPGQLYDYGQRRPSDRSAAKRGGEAVWWLQEIDRSFDHWCVLARFNWRRKDLGWRRPGAPAVDVNFADLGLDPERNYLVFEFWSQTFLGSLKGSFTAVAQDPGRGVDVFAIREARPHPWVIGTTRHLSQGGVSLMEVNWEERGKTLSGTSSVVVGDPYVLTVHVPDGFELKRAEIDGEKAETTRRTEMATIRFVPTETKTVKWKLAFGG